MKNPFETSGSSPGGPDFVVENHGTVFLLRPLTPAANSWVKENLPEDHLTFGHAVVVEHHYIADIVAGAQADGQITIRRLKHSLQTTQPLVDVQGSPLLSEKHILRAWLKERGNHPSKYVFTSQKAGQISRMQLHRIFKDLTEQAGLAEKKKAFHTLKHSLGFMLVEANVNLAVIKQALGHKSIASTAVYTEPTDQTAGKAVVAALASLF